MPRATRTWSVAIGLVAALAVVIVVLRGAGQSSEPEAQVDLVPLDAPVGNPTKLWIENQSAVAATVMVEQLVALDGDGDTLTVFSCRASELVLAPHTRDVLCDVPALQAAASGQIVATVAVGGRTRELRAPLRARHPLALQPGSEILELPPPSMITDASQGWVVAVDDVHVSHANDSMGAQQVSLRIWREGREEQARIAADATGKDPDAAVLVGDHALRLLPGSSVRFAIERRRNVSDTYCARRSDCALRGACTAKGGACVVADDGDCQRSRDCDLWGRCSARDGACVAASADDCDQSWACRHHGRCGVGESGQCEATAAGCAASVGCARGGNCALFESPRPRRVRLRPSWLKDAEESFETTFSCAPGEPTALEAPTAPPAGAPAGPAPGPAMNLDTRL